MSTESATRGAAAGLAIVTPSSSKNLTCTAVGLPRPQVAWYRGQKLVGGVGAPASDLFSTLTVEESRNSVTSVLQVRILASFQRILSCLQVRTRKVSPAWMFAGYECRATNIRGSASASFELRLASRDRFYHLHH